MVNDKHFEYTKTQVHGQLKLRNVHRCCHEGQHGSNWHGIDGVYTAV